MKILCLGISGLRLRIGEHLSQQRGQKNYTTSESTTAVNAAWVCVATHGVSSYSIVGE